MLQRNAGPQPQPGVGGQSRLESQMSNVMNAARSLAGANTAAPAEPAVVGEQYLVFTLVEREFALPATSVQGVERLADVTPVPNVAPWVTGVINLRGSICSVVDLRAFLDLEKLPFNPRTRLLSTKYNEMLICLVVDSVSEMVPIAPNAVDPGNRSIPQWVASYASGVAAVGQRQVILLDAARLLFADKMHHYLV
ncbi:MAG TPA: chemotaxis protein CheW [Ktedonobacteraceae bacterium]